MSGAGAVANGDGNYRIEVADFGPIRRAAVDLRPLTVLAGPSNSGKSYLAMLVYALHQFFGPPDQPPSLQSQRVYWLASEVADSLLGRDGFARRFMDWRSAVSQSGPVALSDDLTGAIRPELERFHGAERFLEREVCRCFAVDVLNNLVRKGSSGTGTVISLDIPSGLRHEPARYRFWFGSDGVAVRGQICELPQVAAQVVGAKYIPGLADVDHASFLLPVVLDGIVESLIGPLIRRAYYLPASRTGVMHSHQVVVSTLIQSATAAGRRPSTNVPLLSGVLADFLDGLIGMSQRAQQPSRKLAGRIGAESACRRRPAESIRDRISVVCLSTGQVGLGLAADAHLFDGVGTGSGGAVSALPRGARRPADHRGAGIASASCLADRIRSGTGAAGAFGSPRSVDHAQRMDPGGARQPGAAVGVAGGAARRHSRRGRGADSGPGGRVAVQARFGTVPAPRWKRFRWIPKRAASPPGSARLPSPCTTSGPGSPTESKRRRPTRTTDCRCWNGSSATTRAV